MSEPDHIIIRPLPNFMVRDDQPAAFPFSYMVPQVRRLGRLDRGSWSGRWVTAVGHGVWPGLPVALSNPLGSAPLVSISLALGGVK